MGVADTLSALTVVGDGLRSLVGTELLQLSLGICLVLLQLEFNALLNLGADVVFHIDVRQDLGDKVVDILDDCLDVLFCKPLPSLRLMMKELSEEDVAVVAGELSSTSFHVRLRTLLATVI